MRHYHEQVGHTHHATYGSNGNGEVENAIRRFSGLLRTMKLCLEKRLQQRVPTDHKVMSWLVGHVAWILTVRVCGADGITAYRRIKGKEFVKRSAGLNYPFTSRSSTEESLTRCWIHSARVSMWRSLPSPLRPHMPRIAVESVHTRRGTFQPRSSRRAWYPSPMPEALTTP